MEIDNLARSSKELHFVASTALQAHNQIFCSGQIFHFLSKRLIKHDFEFSLSTPSYFQTSKVGWSPLPGSAPRALILSTVFKPCLVFLPNQFCFLPVQPCILHHPSHLSCMLVYFVFYPKGAKRTLIAIQGLDLEMVMRPITSGKAIRDAVGKWGGRLWLLSHVKIKKTLPKDQFILANTYLCSFVQQLSDRSDP